MSTPAPPGGPSPLRVGGLVLLGVGVVAGLIGLGTIATNGGFGGQNTAAPTSGVSASATPSAVPEPTESAVPSSSAEVPVPSFGTTPTNGIAAPPPAGPGAAPDGSGSASGAGSGSGSGDGSGGGSAGRSGGVAAVRAPLRVYNNGTISGLAARAAEDFREAGWPVEQVANYPSGIIPTSTVYYRPGTGEQASAEALGSEFGLRVQARFEGLNDASPGLIVIVTNDYQQRG